MLSKLYHEVTYLKKILLSASRVRITTHQNPDGDAIGSLLAFSFLCSYFNIEYDLIIHDYPPPNLHFLPRFKEIELWTDSTMQKLQNENTNVICFLDCGQIDRAGSVSQDILSHQTIINIDHHLTNPLFGDINIVHDISSTSELLVHIYHILNIPITKEIAENLYLGILTDTGCFQYDKVTSNTHILAAELINCGILPTKIFQYVYQSYPESWLILLQISITHLEIYQDIAITYITLEDIKNADGFDDTNVLLPIFATLKNIQVYAFLKEKENNIITASLRSKNNTNVAQIAELFGGGGHRQAAACRTSQYSLVEFKEKILSAIQNYKV